jgi:hypothetical protein
VKDDNFTESLQTALSVRRNLETRVGRVPLIKKYKIGSNQLQFQKLSQELPAMNLWDNKNYEASGSHDFIETVGWASRRMIVFALAISNGFVVLSGTLLAQYQGFPTKCSDTMVESRSEQHLATMCLRH